MRGTYCVERIVEDESVPITQPQHTRGRRCGHCGEPGHDRRTCSAPEQIERRRLQRITRQERLRNMGQSITKIIYKIINNNDYPLNIYWSSGGDILNYTYFVDAFSDTTLSVSKAVSGYRLVCIPYHNRMCNVSNHVTGDAVNLGTGMYFIAGDFNLDDFNQDTPINVIKEYKEPKSELEQWKECGLKSSFLLKQLERMGATHYENLKSLMDMVQDIHLPEHTELDKEMAGVPSTFTNIT